MEVTIPMTKPIIVNCVLIRLILLALVFVTFDILLPPVATMDLSILFSICFVFSIIYC